ncbi:MAG TPA: tetratricopeptide repeat protein [Candidatus Wallbacteria bacterium]|nr:tetratricopeptide repeat protein [Candidatus Wallbacteria bacterium]
MNSSIKYRIEKMTAAMVLMLMTAVILTLPGAGVAYSARRARAAAANEVKERISGEAEAANASGIKLFEGGNYASAAEKFEEALASSPDYTEAAFNMGLCDFMSGDYQTAVSRLHEVLKRDPEFPEAISYLGQAYSNLISSFEQKGDYASAIRCAGEYSKQYFTDDAKKNELAELVSGLIAKAASASAVAPKAANEANDGKAVSAPPVVKEGDVVEKLAALLSKNPSNRPAAAELRKSIGARRISGGFSQGEFDMLEKALNSAVEEDMRNLTAHGALGDLYLMRGNVERAEYHYQMVLIADPADLAASAGMAAARKKKSDSARISELAYPEIRDAMRTSEVESAGSVQEISSRVPAAGPATEEIETVDVADDENRILSTTIAQNIPREISGLKEKIEKSAADIEDLIKTACYYISKKEYKTAEKIINVAFTVDPSDHETNYLMAFVKVRLKKKDEALPYLFSLNPDTLSDARLLHDAGVLYMRLKKPEYAVKFFEKGIEADAGYIENYLSMAIYYSRINDFESARKYFASLASIDPKSMRILYFTALAAKREGRFEEFTQIVKKMQEMSANDPYSKKIRRQMGMAPSEQLLNFESDSSLVETAKNYLRMGDQARAKAKLRDALRINPSSYQANEMMATISHKEGAVIARIIHLLKMYETRPSTELCLELGRAFFGAGLKELGREYYIKYINRSPSDVQAKLEFAEYLKNSGAVISAKTLCEAIIQRAKSGQETAMAEALNNSMADLPDDTSEAEFKTLSEAGAANFIELAKALHSGEMFKMVEHIALQYSATPGDIPVDFLELYASSLFRLKKYVKAVDAYKKMAARERTNFYPYAQIGLIYMKKNNYRAAEQYFRQSLIYKPDEAEVLMNLGDACFFQRNFEDAEVAYAEGNAVARNSLIAEELKLKWDRVKQILKNKR